MSVSENNEAEVHILDSDKVKFRCCCCNVTEKYYMLALFTICNAFLFADQNLLAPNLSILQEEFNFTDNERDTYLGGYISLGFFAIGGVVSLITGFLADKFHRKSVFAISVIIGELSCAATFFVPTKTVTDFWTGLWLTRSITGVALGGAIPIQFSIIGDLFDETARGKAIALFAIANGVGLAFGQGLAGFMSPDFRTPFLIVSLPAFFIVALFLLTTSEPKRGQKEALLKDNQEILEEDHTITWAKFFGIFKVPTIALTIFQGLPGILPWGVIQIFLNDFFVNEGEQDAGGAALAIGVLGLGAGASTLIGGCVMDKYIQTNPKVLALLCGATTFVAPFFLIIVLRYIEVFSGVGLGIVMLLTGISAGFAGTVIKGLLLHVALPETRGTAFSFQTLLDDIGRGVGPYVISVIINASSSREDGLVIGAYGWFFSAFIMFALYFFLEKDIAKSQEILKEAYGIADDATEEDKEKDIVEVKAKKEADDDDEFVISDNIIEKEKVESAFSI